MTTGLIKARNQHADETILALTTDRSIDYPIQGTVCAITVQALRWLDAVMGYPDACTRIKIRIHDGRKRGTDGVPSHVWTYIAPEIHRPTPPLPGENSPAYQRGKPK